MLSATQKKNDYAWFFIHTEIHQEQFWETWLIEFKFHRENSELEVPLHTNLAQVHYKYIEPLSCYNGGICKI